MMNLMSRSLRDPFHQDRDVLSRFRYGVIEVRDGALWAIHVRRWPKVISALEVEWIGHRRHRQSPGDQCLLYYNQPRCHANYLALKYVVSRRDCRLATFHRALEALDEVARVKQSDAILCDVFNERITDRMLAQRGWEPHHPRRWHRHYIKRFYGAYPPPRIDDWQTEPAADAAGTPVPA